STKFMAVGSTMASVTIHQEGTPPRTVPLREAVTTLGRSVDNVLEVTDANMSRRHCVIERRGDNDFILTDCNSSNGTRVNGDRVLSHELKDGDRIEVGSTILAFSFDDGHEPSSMETPTKGSPLRAVLDDAGRPRTPGSMTATSLRPVARPSSGPVRN